MQYPLIRLSPFYPGQFGVAGSDAPLGLRAMPYGKVFFVHDTHGNSSDSNDGTHPDGPLKTITGAIAKATAGQDDWIIVQSFSNALETFPLALSKSKVHLFSSQYVLGEVVPGHGRIITPPADTAAILITGDRVEVAGFDMSAGATHGCIEFSQAVQSWGAHIHHNRLGWMSGAQDGIRMTGAVDKVHFVIHDNEFNDKITRDGIRIEQNSTRGVIYRNRFRGVAGIGINLVTLCTDIYAIYDNFFRVADAATGEAITCNANSVGCMFWGNQAMQGKVAMANVPFRDLGANHWGLNYMDVTATLPVIV
jgi:hypothetical protein